MNEWIYGRRTVVEHLKEAPDSCRRLLFARGSQMPADIVTVAKALGLPIEEVEKGKIDRLSQGENHQGVCLEVGGWSYAELEDVVRRARGPGRLPLVVALDSVQDPRNLGAVLRVADGVGAAGVVIPKDRAAGLTPAVARAAAGAVAAVPVTQVVNLARTLGELRDEGFWAVGASGDASVPLFDQTTPFPCVLVLGGEHKGLRPNVAAHCDALVSLPMRGAVSSLNVSVAAGVFCYEILRRWESVAD